MVERGHDIRTRELSEGRGRIFFLDSPSLPGDSIVVSPIQCCRTIRCQVSGVVKVGPIHGMLKQEFRREFCRTRLMFSLFRPPLDHLTNRRAQLCCLTVSRFTSLYHIVYHSELWLFSSSNLQRSTTMLHRRNSTSVYLMAYRFPQHFSKGTTSVGVTWKNTTMKPFPLSAGILVFETFGLFYYSLSVLKHPRFNRA